MQHTFRLSPAAITFMAALMFTACQKMSDRPVKLPFKADTKTFYRFAPVLTGPIPVVVNGTNYLGFSHVPGKGNGTASHIGYVRTYFNQLAYWPEGTKDPNTTPTAGSVSAPVADIPSYPLILPFPPNTPPESFADVAPLNVPATISGTVVNSIFISKTGEALYTGYVGNSTVTPLSATKIQFTGAGKILGGTGRFAKAIGSFNYTGFFNPQDQNEAGYSVDGWISY